ncbi:Ldh family oxidoreductase [Pararobbsia silviterrae]|uniref:Ldh family oxidoreductase n=1 Tax=Pararobbsia silviterrae TaxID=1792498 RepID=A0A494X6M3_9BURK|nr:Ldh family oxidoreductase [Pararobbsia silviterrae]RKP43916.1 Ldh family oxidoreductase [Pararobbsia silviterrae]
MNNAQSVSVSGAHLSIWVAQILESCGVSETDARWTADALVEADLQGVSSHGCMLLPMYVERIKAGSVNARPRIAIVDDRVGLLVVDADHALGQVSSMRATDWAIERARRHGVAIVAVRNAFHFGAAAYWSARMADAGIVGAAMSNTRPLMPAPGGAERVVGNNPLSFAFPTPTCVPVVVDMATSNSAMGKIRNAQRDGKAIPEGWATDKQGRPTTSASDAIAGMLLPAAGAKGFGLSVVVDLLCGGLSGGGIASEVQPLYGSADTFYNCAHWFLAIAAPEAMPERTEALAERIRRSARAPGVGSIYAPGDLERERRARNVKALEISSELAAQFDALSRAQGIDALQFESSHT